jgi:sugar O-acyltransferase (sialic acid O-acetyltransferase NeuD family)
MQKILLIGGGGHCKVVIQAVLHAGRYKIAGIIDVKEKIGKEVLGFPVIGADQDMKKYFKKGIRHCFITLGSIGKPEPRIRLFNVASGIGFKFPNIIHPGSFVSKFAGMGSGNYIGPAAVINPGAAIGNNCIINTGAVIEHDVKIGDFVHVAPGVAVSGGAMIGKHSHIGTGSCVSQDIKIGENAIIGTGSVVVDDIKSNSLAYGNPCREIKANA